MSEEIIIDGVNVAECEHCMYKGFKAFPQCKLNLDSFATACQQHKDCYFKQLKRLQETLKHVENGRKVKAEKLKRIEEIVTHCIQGGFTDEFVQEIFDICREYEEV